MHEGNLLRYPRGLRRRISDAPALQAAVDSKAMIHEIEPRKLDGTFRLLDAELNDFAFFFRNGNCLLPEGFEAGIVPKLRDFPASAFEEAGQRETEYLFSINNEKDGKNSEEDSERFFLLLP